LRPGSIVEVFREEEIPPPLPLPDQGQQQEIDHVATPHLS
jgi:hypothetical protein